MAFQDMVDYLDSCWKARGFIVPCLIGPVGIGKTAAVHQHAKNVGAGKIVTIIASQILPNEVSGITMPDSDTKAMEIYDHFRLSNLKDGDILFFDELLEADQMVLKACLTLIESREMMSGRKLPDIQIVAATNPSIMPDMLRENIRQRFVFRKFDIDRADTADYIKKKTGIEMPDKILNMLKTTGKEYNILTPRSLTKMAEWITSAGSKDEAAEIAMAIDMSWNIRLGSVLFDAMYNKSCTQHKAKQAVYNIVQERYEYGTAMRQSCDPNSKLHDLSILEIETLCEEDKFYNQSLEEIMELIAKLPDFEEITKALDNIEIED